MATKDTTNDCVVIKYIKFLVRPLAARGRVRGAPEDYHSINMVIRPGISKMLSETLPTCEFDIAVEGCDRYALPPSVSLLR